MSVYKIFITVILISVGTCINALYSQNPVSQIDGRLEVIDTGDSSSVYIGKKAGAVIGGTDDLDFPYGNTYLGAFSGENNVGYSNSFFGFNTGMTDSYGGNNSLFGSLSGERLSIAFGNSFFGAGSGRQTRNADGNSFFGYQAGYNNVDGFHNTFLGGRAGRNMEDGHSNIMIGHNAGPTHTESSVSERLFIHNSTSNNPLIYGEFDNNLIRINGDLDVTGDLDIHFKYDSTSLFLGYEAGAGIDTMGSFCCNTGVGRASGYSLTSGLNNSFYGNKSGELTTTGKHNTFLGHNTGM